MRVALRASWATGMRSEDSCLAPNRRAARRAALALFVGSVLLGLTSGGVQAQSSASDTLRLGPIALLGDGPSYVDLGAGVYDLVGNAHRNQTFAADAEFRYGQKFYGVGPAVGIIQDARGGGMAYLGFYSDFALGPVVVTPLAGLGAWWHGGNDDEQLGGTFEFRLGLSVAYQFDNQSRLGIRLGHISNASLHRRNPGDNDLMLTYALPLNF
jgi:lipid A 3-O-deacylase